jgi:hypothetical protein
LFTRAERLDPSFVDPVWNGARLLESAGRLDEARAKYARVLELAPGHGPARSALGRLGAGAKPRETDSRNF